MVKLFFCNVGVLFLPAVVVPRVPDRLLFSRHVSFPPFLVTSGEKAPRLRRTYHVAVGERQTFQYLWGRVLKL